MSVKSPLSVDASGALRPAPDGFTLIEIIVILAVISILLTIITATALRYIADARIDNAQAGVQKISSVINDLMKDAGQFPGSKLASGKTFLCGPGDVGLGGQTWGAIVTCEDLANHLVINNPGTSSTSDDYPSSGKSRWKGPYITNLADDPWGNAYQINASTLVAGDTGVTWVISAGPDGNFQTSPSSTSLSGDDIGARIK